TLEEATPAILEAICRALDFQVGNLWLLEPNASVLKLVQGWHFPDIAVSHFEALSHSLNFTLGVGLPGRVWASREPAWIADVVEDPNFPRAKIAAEEGLHGAFGCPMFAVPTFYGVIEFFSDSIQKPDPDLLNLISTIGS